MSLCKTPRRRARARKRQPRPPPGPGHSPPHPRTPCDAGPTVVTVAGSPASDLGFRSEAGRGSGARAGRRLPRPQPGPRPPAAPRPGPRRARRPRGTSRPPPASSPPRTSPVPRALPARWPPLPGLAPPGQVYTPEKRRLYGFSPSLPGRSRCRRTADSMLPLASWAGPTGLALGPAEVDGFPACLLGHKGSCSVTSWWPRAADSPSRKA